MAGRKVVVEFLGEDKSLGKTMGEVDGKSSKLMGTLGKVGKVAAVALAAGAVAGGVALVKMTQGAIEDEAAQQKLAKTLENTAGATKKQVAGVEEWISSLGTAYGVADDELRPALARLSTATGDVTKAQGLTRLAMDVSAGSGKSLEQVSTALMKAQNGQVSALSRLGVNTKNAAGETISMEEAQRRLAETFGGQATAQANTLEGKMARLKLVLAETGETIGSKMIPVVTTMADWFLNKGVPAISAFGGWIQNNMLPVLQRLGDWISTNVLPAFQKMGDWLAQRVLPVFQSFGSQAPSIFERVRSVLENAIQTMQKVAGVVASKMAPVFSALVDTFRSRVAPTIALIVSRFEEWQPTINKVVTKIASLAATILGTVLPPVIRFAGVIISNVVPAVLDAIEVLAKIIGKVASVGSAFVDGVKDVGKFVQGIKDKVGNAMDYLGGIPEKAKEAIGSLGSTLKDAGMALIQGLIDGITSKVSALKDKLQSVTKLIPDWKGPLDKDKILLTPAGEALMEGLIKGIESKKTRLQTVLEKITDEVQKRQDKLAALLDRRQSIVDSFKGFATSVFGAPGGEDGSGPTAQGLVDFSGQQRSQAEQLQADVAALVSKGLSNDLIDQMVSQGQSGIAQIHALASATDEQIRAVNANNAATQAALEAAGLKAADAVVGEQIKQAERDVKLADTIRDKLAELMKEQDKNTVIQIKLSGRTLQASLLQLKRETGQNLELA